jgi:hypothetical protein
MPNVIDRSHNKPPELIDLNDPDALRVRLETDYAEMVALFGDREIGIGQVPATIDDDETAQRVTTFVAQQVRALTADAKTAHEREKKPFLACGRVIDNFFLRRIDHLNQTLTPVLRRAENYIKAKAEAQRRAEEKLRREAEMRRIEAENTARRLEAEKQRAIEEGERKRAAELQKQRDAAQTEADNARLIEHAAPAPVRVHGDYGSTAYLVERWHADIEDPNLVPKKYWVIDETLIKRDVDAGIRDIPGIRIYREDQFRIRRC